MTERIHAVPPMISAEVFGAVAEISEKHPDARMVVMHDPVANATLMARTKSGYVEFWNLLSPMSENQTRVVLAQEVEGDGIAENEIVFLKMAEVAPEHLKLN